ncbi:MAG: hypothetical protein HQL63_03010 [Magnetococcales bacterium]|nr:hypothetical protein [Magnetococcales bacterium]MBF0321866.1 hypothetical protein [Magnetococcales bacterium]
MISTSGLHIDQAPPLHIPFRFFATAPLFIACAGVVVFGWGPDLWQFPLSPQTIALAHLAVLGWISMVMFGAMYQMIPVLAGLPMPWLRLAPWVHAGLIIGVITFFLEIGFGLHRWLLLVASAGLGIALGFFILQTGRALVKTTVRHPTVHAMRIALLSLSGVLILGAIFLGEYAHGFLNVDRETLLGMHLVWGLLGWMGTLIIGVSMQVLPMFYVMPMFPVAVGNKILVGLGTTLIALPAALWFAAGQPVWVWLTALPAGVAIVYYALAMKRIFAARKRKIADVTYQFWLVGLGCGGISLLLPIIWPITDAERWRFLFAVIFLWGGVSSIIFGMLYKIVPFLVWFHRFSRLAGLVPNLPMMDDLLPERTTRIHFVTHCATILLLVTGINSSFPLALSVAGLGMILSGGLLAHAIYAATSHKAPPAPDVPDFNSFFKDFSNPEHPTGPSG